MNEGKCPIGFPGNRGGTFPSSSSTRTEEGQSGTGFGEKCETNAGKGLVASAKNMVQMRIFADS
jgi:hypothetical protein